MSFRGSKNFVLLLAFVLGGIALALLWPGIALYVSGLECARERDQESAARCMLDLILASPESESPAASMHRFAQLRAWHAGVFEATPASCHALAHAVGEELYERMGYRGVLERLTPSSDALECGGFYHELLERAFMEEANAASVDEVCSQFLARVGGEPMLQHICHESAGSGFVRAQYAEHRADLSDLRMMSEHALDLCEGQRVNDEFVEDCMRGVFGEVFYRILEFQEPTLYDGTSYALACKDVRLSARAACASQAAATFFMDPDYSLRLLFEFNASPQLQDVQRAQFESGLKIFLLDTPLRMPPARLLDECAALWTQQWCIEALARASLEGVSSVPDPEGALDFCGSDAVGERGLEAPCFGAIGPLMPRLFSQAQVKKLCERIPSEFRHVCD